MFVKTQFESLFLCELLDFRVSAGTTLIQPGTKMQFRLARPLNL